MVKEIWGEVTCVTSRYLNIECNFLRYSGGYILKAAAFKMKGF
jgi:hypothetical protein